MLIIVIKPFALFNWRGRPFRIGARIDKTLKWHFAGGFVFGFLGPSFSFGITQGMELIDGAHSEQGYDLLDALAGLLGLYLHVAFRLPVFELTVWLLNLLPTV